MDETYECWAWVGRGTDGREGLVATVVPGLEFIGLMPLISREQDLAEGDLAVLSMEHQLREGEVVRLVHLQEVRDEF